MAKINNTIIDIPKNPDEAVSLKTGNTEINISLPELDNPQEGEIVAKGVVAYASESDFSNTVQANNDGSVRMTTIIDNPDAPTEYEYKVDLPTGGKIELQSDGSAIVYNNKQEPISIIAKPWAKDANGKEVKTWFSTDGLTLIQNVEHNVADIVYPVVADPVWIPAAIVGFAVWAATACVVSVVQDLGIAGVQHALRGDWNWRNRLESASWNCAGGEFDTQVKNLAGAGQYRLVYLDGQDQLAEQIHQILGDCALNQALSRYVSGLHNRPIQMGNICCNACISAEPEFFQNLQLIDVQKAAIKIEGMKTGD